ncbi:MAG: FKBP-type peptidyl-prolyl cis-trans isomerase, partial [Candidatus Tectomicrobia bacterium]|nr:FKBP-type peptidyl-prolyl cis-trans isomerase [Candidatus Tectomicrobia bacterium]
MRALWSHALVALLLTGTVVSAVAPEITSDEHKTLYALGLALSRSLGGFGLSEAEVELVKMGLTDGVLQRDPKVDLQQFLPKVQELQQTRAAAVAAV